MTLNAIIFMSNTTFHNFKKLSSDIIFAFCENYIAFFRFVLGSHCKLSTTKREVRQSKLAKANQKLAFN